MHQEKQSNYQLLNTLYIFHKGGVMLQVENVEKEKELKSILEVDYYIPISLKFLENSLPINISYNYRLFNESLSFIEILINPSNKKIKEISMISMNKTVNFSNKGIDFSNIDKEYRNPIINIEKFNGEKVLDIKENFSVMYNNSKIYIFLERINEVTKKIIIPNLELLVNQENIIVGFIFKDFSYEQEKEIKSLIDSKKE